MSGTGYELGVQCGITFAGIKAASLFWLDNERESELLYYRRCFGKKNFCFMAVKRGQGKKLFYVFHQGKLNEILFDSENRKFLSSLGYEYESAGAALRELKRRMECGDGFPHEIGMFLGYPLEDVRGFIEDARGGISLESGYWKVYCRPSEKARLFERYRRCSDCICRKMSCGTPIEEIFKLT